MDFASRECQDAFFTKIDKGQASTAPVVEQPSATQPTTPVSTRPYVTPAVNRSRASSFSRPGNPISGTGSPNSTPSAGSTPRHLSAAVAGTRTNRLVRYSTGSNNADGYYEGTEFMDGVTSTRRPRNYDEYSQGSGASHEDLYEASEVYPNNVYARERAESPPPPSVQSRLDVPAEELSTSITSSSVRRRCEKSPGMCLAEPNIK